MADQVWILTEEYNDYDQHGEYFLAWFKDKPSKEQIQKHADTDLSDETLNHILSGGGREEWEHQWFNLSLTKEDE